MSDLRVHVQNGTLKVHLGVCRASSCIVDGVDPELIASHCKDDWCFPLGDTMIPVFTFRTIELVPVIDRRKLDCCSYVLHPPYNLCWPTAHWYDCQPNNIIRQCRVRKSCRYAIAWGRENWLLRTCNRVHSFPFSQQRFNFESDGCLANSTNISAKGSPSLVLKQSSVHVSKSAHHKRCQVCSSLT